MGEGAGRMLELQVCQVPYHRLAAPKLALVHLLAEEVEDRHRVAAAVLAGVVEDGQ